MKKSPTRHDFRAASSLAILDKRLQSAVRKTAGLLARMRANTVADKPGFEELRSWGRERKLVITENLEKWAAQFSRCVEEQGGVVHRAQDADEAGRIIADIARQRGITSAVKSKSMTAEEVGLNHVLEAAGIEVTETDLGEFIIQLAGERPSHILAPAIHRNRDDVRKLFAEKLGASEDLDVEGLVRFARQVLRRRFFEAGMGITGGNFAVADTGTVAIVTNEGNGRMCTTLPPVHVALVGLEKLIPSIKDLPDFLSLLTCSATGQRASSYISMTTGPRRPGESEGPQEFHVVLLDNGRSHIAAGPWREILHCLHCGSCLNQCPIYNAVGGHAYESPYPGPIGSVFSSLIWGRQEYPDLANACTLCGRCAEICAVKIPLPEYHRSLRGPGKQTSFTSKLAAQMTSSPASYRYGMKTLRGLLRIKPLANLLPALSNTAANWSKCRVLPVPKNDKPFRDWWQNHQPKQESRKLQRAANQSQQATTPPSVTQPVLTKNELFDLYRQRAGAVGVAIREISQTELPALLCDLLKEESVSCTALPSKGWSLPIHELILKTLTQNNMQVMDGDAAIADLGTAQLGITHSPAFLADTGSLIFPAAPGFGTAASLLPEVHLAISLRSALLADLNAYFSEHTDPMPSRLIQVTGPSRTGDIEGTMTVGVHGPRRVLHWILREDTE